jgi:hypothetical protein
LISRIIWVFFSFVKPLVDLYVKILEEHDLCDGISPSLEEEDHEEEYYHAVILDFGSEKNKGIFFRTS